MQTLNSLSALARQLTWVTAAAFGALGAVLFFAPAWAMQNFPWTVSPFLAMTIGAWYLGAAFVGFLGARTWDWGANHGALIFLWTFGILEGVAILLHVPVFKLDATLALPYLIVLGISIIAALVGAYDWVRIKPGIDKSGRMLPVWLRVLAVGFAGVALLIALLLLLGMAPGGTIWPKPITPLSQKAFGMFFLAMFFAVLPLALGKGARGAPMLLLIATIGGVIVLIPAFMNLGLFDFVKQPGGYVYIGTYVFSTLASSAALWLLKKRSA